MKIKRLLEIIFLALLCLSAPLISEAKNRNTFVLPKLEKSAEASALGENAASLQGLNALGVNPAGLYGRRTEILTTYQQLPLETNLAHLAFSFPLPWIESSAALNYLRLKSENLDGRDEFGDSKGEFDAQEQEVGIHLGFAVKGLVSAPLSLGLSVSYLEARSGPFKDGGHSIDLGARISLKNVPLSLGASILDMGHGPSLLSEEAVLPVRLLLSAALQASGGLTIVGSALHSFEENRQEVSVGVQYWVNNRLALRGQYAVLQRRLSDGFDFQNFSAGFGLKVMAGHTVDYAFQPLGDGLREVGHDGTHLISFVFRFAGPSSDDLTSRTLRKLAIVK